MGGGTNDLQLVWLDRHGERLGTVGEPGTSSQVPSRRTRGGSLWKPVTLQMHVVVSWESLLE